MNLSPAPAARHKPPSRTYRRVAQAWILACVAVTAVAATAFADARTDYLVRALQTSSSFRVRVQAAISLGSVRSEPAVIEALTRALRDDHPTVRAAAASALGRQGDPSALAALRRLTRDRESAVRRAASRAIAALERIARSEPRTRAVPDRSGDARFYVAVGRPGTRDRSVSRAALDQLREYIEQQVRGIDGVEVAPSNERRSAANRVIRARDLAGYYLDCSIVEIEERGAGVRVRVSVVVQTYPGRNIRGMLNGAATVTSGRGEQAIRQAMEGAVRGALRRLPSVMSAGARSAGARASREGR